MRIFGSGFRVQGLKFSDVGLGIYGSGFEVALWDVIRVWVEG